MLKLPGPLAQTVASLIVDPGVVSFIPALSHKFVEIDHEIFSTVILWAVTSKSICQDH